MRRMITQKMIDYIKGLQGQMSFDAESGKVVFKDALFIEANGVSAPIFLDFDAEDNPIIGVNALKVDTFADIGGDASIGGDAQIDGDLSVAGDLDITGNTNGILKDGLEITFIEGITVNFMLSKKIEDVNLLQFRLTNETGDAIASGTTIGSSSYVPSSTIQFVGFSNASIAVFAINTSGDVKVYSSGSISTGAIFGGNVSIQIVS